MDQHTRFQNATDVDIESLLTDRDSQNTKRVIQTSVKIMENYIADSHTSTNIADISALYEIPTTDFNLFLRKFNEDIRKANGEFYAKKSMISVRFGLQRHFVKKRDEDIINDADFKSANDVFKAVLVRISKLGVSESKHKPPITTEDLDKLYNHGVFDVSTSSGLLNRVFFEFMYFFCKRGRENLRSLKKSDFVIRVDSQGKRYVVMKTEHQTKNHRGDDLQNEHFSQARMYEIPGNERCPVATFEKYLSKLNPEIDDFWQRPKKNVTESSAVWYDAVPLGKNTLCSLMSKISHQASLSEIYTNHCIRATCITNLDQHGIESRHIIGISGHKREGSLKSYSSKLSDNKKDISKVLAESTTNSMSRQNTVQNNPDVQHLSKNVNVPEFDVSHIDFLDDDAVNDLLSKINEGSYDITENNQNSKSVFHREPCYDSGVPHQGVNVYNSVVHVHYYQK
ncbi:uncharacterized protein LOC117338811 [Pecten maximus]|uniref:uncharacterized protein LOC117338811 n=1 Tax=Pecten maximus TaxID=6579 RepID=UPI001458DDEB|nr:uncharacterized protein LOC117338811 [Pecten maximus]